MSNLPGQATDKRDAKFVARAGLPDGDGARGQPLFHILAGGALRE
jgi:hypothetical protein